MIVINCSEKGIEPSPGLKNIVQHLEHFKFEVKLLHLEEFTPEHMRRAEGIVLSGARRMLSEQPELIEKTKFLKDCPVPVLGICFGHQLLGAIHGATIHDAGHMIKGFYRVVFSERYPLFCEYEHESVFEQEHQQMVSVPEEFDLCAQSELCENEAMRHKTKPYFGVQFHPERHDSTASPLFHNFALLCRKYDEDFTHLPDEMCRLPESVPRTP